jgi:peroxiredoxin
MTTRSPARSTLALLVCTLWALGVSPGRTVAGPTNVQTTSDVDLAEWIRSLDARLAAKSEPSRWKSDARFALWEFGRRIQKANLRPAQEDLVLAHLDRIEREHRDASSIVQRARYMVSALSVGKTAPDIAGQDLDGQSMRLSDYRGKVVLLVFSGDWCGICRSDYPYERLLLELYANWPFAIVGVDGSTTIDTATAVKTRERLTFRSWWDGDGSSRTAGPIATEWNVVGWPATYVLDQKGVIRYVDLQKEDLLKSVRELLNDETRRAR